MRIFSYVYHGLLALFMLAVSFLALLGGNHNLRLDLLPWTGAALTYSLLGLGLFAAVVTILALKGIARMVFFAWTVAVFVLLFRGFFLAPYFFRTPGDMWTAIYLTLGAILAVLGGWFVFRRQASMKRKY